MKSAILLATVIFALPAFAQEAVIRDSLGQQVGTLERNRSYPNELVIRDDMGRFSGTVDTKTGTIRDAMGSYSGQVSQPQSPQSGIGLGPRQSNGR